MADIWILLLAGAAMVLLGFIAAQLFDRFRFPDYFILMSIGLLLGSGVIPLGGADPRASLATIAPVLTSIALAFILFEGGLILRVRGMGRAWGIATFHTGLAMALAIAGMWFAATVLLRLAPTTALILALAFCGPSATIVLSFLPRLNVADRTRFTLTVEGVVGNIVAAVLVLFLVHPPGDVSNLSTFVGFAAPLAIAVGVAYVVGEAWALTVGGRRAPSFAFMTSVALAVLLYAVGDGLLRGNGGLAAFVFGLVMGHRRVLVAPNQGAPGSRGLQEFHRELVFLLRTFFFLYLGIRVRLAEITLAALVGAVLFTGVFFASRWPSTAVVSRVWRLPSLDSRVLRATVARGMTDTVLILFAIEQGAIPPSEAVLVTDLLFLVILVAAFASASFVFRAEWIARRVAIPAAAPSITPPSAVAPGAEMPAVLDRALSEFLENPIVKQGEID